MSDLYKVGQSGINYDSQLNPLGLGIKILLTIFTLISAALYYSIYSTVPAIKEVFESFGLEIPLMTKILMDGNWLFLLLALASLLPLIIWLNHSQITRFHAKIKSLTIKCFVISIFAYIAVSVSVSLPIDAMGGYVKIVPNSDPSG